MGDRVELRRFEEPDLSFLHQLYDIHVGPFVELPAASHAQLLDAAGFGVDGILRGVQYRNGTWHDVTFYSRTETPDTSDGVMLSTTTASVDARQRRFSDFA